MLNAEWQVLRGAPHVHMRNKIYYHPLKLYLQKQPLGVVLWKSCSILQGLHVVDISWSVLEEKVFSQETVFLYQVIRDKKSFIFPGIQVRARNKCRTHFSHNIQLLNRTPQFTRPLYIAVCQFFNDKKERHRFLRKLAKNFRVLWFCPFDYPEHPNIPGKKTFLTVHLILPVCLRLQQNHYFFTVKATLTGTLQTSTHKHTSEYFFYRTVPSSCFPVWKVHDNNLPRRQTFHWHIKQ